MRSAEYSKKGERQSSLRLDIHIYNRPQSTSTALMPCIPPHPHCTSNAVRSSRDIHLQQARKICMGSYLRALFSVALRGTFECQAELCSPPVEFKLSAYRLSCNKFF